MSWNFNYYSLSNRVDYQPSEKHRFFARWNWSTFHEHRADWTYTTLTDLQDTNGIRDNKGAVIDWVYLPTPTSYFDFAVDANTYPTGSLIITGRPRGTSPPMSVYPSIWTPTPLK